MKFWSSTKLAVILLIMAAIATLIGSVLPQETSLERQALINAYADPRYDFLSIFDGGNPFIRFQNLSSLGLTNVFFSAWYLFLMLVFFISITFASFKKVFPKAKFAFKWLDNFTEQGLENFPLSESLKKETDPKLIKSFFKKKLFMTKDLNIKVGKYELIFQAMRGAYHRLGASSVHVGIICLMAGACYGMMTGFGGFVALNPGQKIFMKDAEIKRVPYLWFGEVPDVSIEVLDTWMEIYKDGTPKQYYSDLKLYDSDDELIQQHRLMVNEPLKLGNFYVYQNTFGEYMSIQFNGNPVDMPIQKMNGKDVSVLEISEDFILQLIPMKPEGEEEFVTAFAILPDRETDKVVPFFLAKKNQMIEIGPEGFPIEFKYLGLVKATGLQYKSNPGAPLIYLGFAIMILGIFIAFGSKKQFVLVKDVETGDYKILGLADRAKDQFIRDYSRKIAKFREDVK